VDIKSNYMTIQYHRAIRGHADIHMHFVLEKQRKKIGKRFISVYLGIQRTNLLVYDKKWKILYFKNFKSLQMFY